jgi:tRNA threonylcarbamoyladenosine biosynthesis protein TsaB
MIWLGIDTANTPLSIAIVKNGELLIEENSSMAVNHSLRAMPAIEEVFLKVGMTPTEIDAIAVSEGPGSYTGVRIGVTIAKTLAWTLEKPLVGISSLKALATNGLHFEGLICPIVDARRGNVYSAAYKFTNGNLESVIDDGHYSVEEFINKLENLNETVLFIGKDASLHKNEIVERLGQNAVLAPLHYNLPRASSLIYAAQQSTKITDVHSFVPEYRRLAEAEANWLKEQRKDKNRD